MPQHKPNPVLKKQSLLNYPKREHNCLITRGDFNFPLASTLDQLPLANKPQPKITL